MIDYNVQRPIIWLCTLRSFQRPGTPSHRRRKEDMGNSVLAIYPH